ncbi:MAG: cobalt ECF transporter T component CbiQ [Desulfomonile tiedjei]|uniref:Cobalt ECF transporter T component CbiQ n=1 Tax=Desulfomonile tiedjei TaxID=2358 RepID=A0A9D6Z4F7_9BACT|nr:cobalt ECF transporter T component CbiQ [Desulfomonile tiedjei]
MQIEEFALGNSIIHRLDPRVKIVVTFIFSIMVAVTNSIATAAVAMILPVVLILTARVDLVQVLRRVAVVNTFVLFLCVFLPFTYPGRTILSFGPLDVHMEGLTYAALITIKSNAVILMVIALLGTSPVFSLVHALSRMGLSEKLVHLFFFCFRYIHVIHEEYHRLSNAMKMRGFKAGTNMHTYRSYAYLMGMLLVRSFDRSARIFAAMKCRAFKGRFYVLHDYRMKRGDYLLAATSVLFSCCLLIVK